MLMLIRHLIYCFRACLEWVRDITFDIEKFDRQIKEWIETFVICLLLIF